MMIRNFSEAISVLQKYVPAAFDRRQSYSLDRIKQFMKYLGNPQDTVKVIHIAGTSGKTSTAYYCAALLHAAGYKVGLTVSPHIMQLNERVQVNGVPMPEAVFCTSLGTFLDLATDSKIELTYFELLVAFAYWEFARQQVDYAVVEVGLGGLMDGTNTITRADKTCIITDIGFDHVAVLGNTLHEIAEQKAGIIQPNNQVFMYEQADDIMQAVQTCAANKHASLRAITPSAKDNRLTSFQKRNFHLAYAAISAVLPKTISQAAINTALQTLVPARFEIFQYGQTTVILDGSHNQQKIAAFSQSLQERFPDTPVTAVVALVSGNVERQEPVVHAIGTWAAQVVLTTFTTSQDSPKVGLSIDELQTLFKADTFTGQITTAISPLTAVQQAIADKQTLVVVIGSFYSLSEVRAWLLQQTSTQ